MEFDKSRIYSAVNADELRAGDKVIVSDTMSMLTLLVRETTDSMELATLKKVRLDNEVARFETSTGNWCLAYLVERKENCTNCKHSCCRKDGGDISQRWCRYYESLEPKTTEINTKLNLCSSCQHSFAECPATELDIKFGDGVGNDNVYECSEYKPKTEQKAEKHTDYNHCEEATKAYACAMTNACPNKHYRPFKDTDELIEEWDKKLGYRDPTGLAEPYIWVRSKYNKDHKGVLINNYFGEYVELGTVQCFLSRLFDEYTFLDGSVCGVEE